MEQDLVNELIDMGLAADLLELLESVDVSALEIGRNTYLRGAVLHLQFVATHGNEVKYVERDDGTIWSGDEDYLQGWIEAGCPGVSVSELKKLKISKQAK